LKKTVSSTALSVVGAALPAGGAVCAIVAGVSAHAPASHAVTINASRIDLIAYILPNAACDASENRSDTFIPRIHFRAMRACSPIARDGYATTRPGSRPLSVKHLTCVLLHLRYWSD
jgi:hypothetical protein